MIGHEQRFAKGEVIIHQGEMGDRVYRIKTGQVLICKTGPDGEMVPISKLGVGEIFGEMYLMNKGGHRNATVVASNEVTLDVYFDDSIRQEFNEMKPFQRLLTTALSERLEQMTDHYAQEKLQDEENRDKFVNKLRFSKIRIDGDSIKNSK